MDCLYIKSELHGFLRNELDEKEKEIVRSHLASCPTCSGELASIQRTISLLHTIEEITPRQRVWLNINRRIYEENRFAKKRLWFYATAAAALVFVLFTLTILKTFEEHYKYEYAYAVRELPNKAGKLIFRENSSYKIISPKEIFLKEGEIFAEVEPNTGGFVVHTEDANTEVLGTKFGIRITKSKKPQSILYVIDGKVKFSSKEKSVVVTAGSTASVEDKGIIDVKAENAYECIAWLKERGKYPPTIALSTSANKNKFMIGEEVAFKIALSNETDLPLLLEPFDKEPPYIFFKVTDPNGKEYQLKPGTSMIRSKQFQSRVNGYIKLGSKEEGSIECLLSTTLLKEQGIFKGDGMYNIAVIYSSSDILPNSISKGVWAGLIESNPVELEIIVK